MKADVIIIGAGVLGLSIAYHLARQDKHKRIIILEKEKFHGAGSTAQCTGGIRHQFTNPVNIQLVKLSYPFFQHFAAEMHYPIYFRQRGYLFAAASPTKWQELQNMYDILTDLDIPAQLMTPEQIKTDYPFVHTDDLLGASFCPLDAYADPYGVMEGYYRQSRSLGVQVFCNAEVTGLSLAGQSINGVYYHLTNNSPDSEPEMISTSLVINAAGPHLHLIAQMAGIKLPAAPYRRQVYVCAPLASIPPDVPLLVDLDTGFYVHAEKNGILLLGGTDRDTSPGLARTVDRSRLAEFTEQAVSRIPSLEEARITNIYTGIRSLTPDGLGILGETKVKGFYCIGGFGGTGFMHAPAIGMITACLLAEATPPIDPMPFSPNRFQHTKAAEKTLF